VAVPRIALVIAAVAVVLVGSGALARTLPFRPIALPGPGGDPAEAPSSTADGDGAPLRGAAPFESVPPASSAEPSPVPAAPSETSLPADPTDPPTSAAPIPEPVTIEYEAEAADLSGFVRLFEVAEASGGDVVGMIGTQSSSHVSFPEVTVDSTGEYELTLFYVSAPDRQAVVTVNEGEPVVLDFPGLGDASEVGAVSVPVQLAAGPNAIWFGNADQPAPALDRITVEG
jgi:hypothetical protein